MGSLGPVGGSGVAARCPKRKLYEMHIAHREDTLSLCCRCLQPGVPPLAIRLGR